MERAAVKIPVGDCMCLGRHEVTQASSKSLSLGKRLKSGCWWPGSLIETAQDGRPKPVEAGNRDSPPLPSPWSIRFFPRLDPSL